MFLAQGSAQHFIDGRHGVKDFDVWSIYLTEAPAAFPWKGQRKGHVDFGPSPHGRNVYTPAEPRILCSDRRSGGGRRFRVGVWISWPAPYRFTPMGPAGRFASGFRMPAGKQWRPPPKRMPSPWWIARRPVIELWPEATTVVWDPKVDLTPDADPAPPKADEP